MNAPDELPFSEPTKQPNQQPYRKDPMKVSRVVLIVVALHVLVIGGIFVFEGCSRTKSPTPDMAANESQPGETPAAPATDPSMIPAPQPVVSMPATAAPLLAQPTVVTQTAPASKTYSVRHGDSLWKIAKIEGVSVGDLARANNLGKTTALKIGQKLQIPAAARAETFTAQASVIPTGTGAPAAETVSATGDIGGTAYTVQSGDSLWKIARRQNVTVVALKHANSLSSDALKVGQKLTIPAATTVNTTVAGVATPATTSWLEPGKYTENGQTIHIVDVNETPGIIAMAYAVRVDDLMKANNITDARKINYGQRLVIPTAPVTTTAPAVTITPAAATTVVPTITTAAPTLAAPVVSASQITVN